MLALVNLAAYNVAAPLGGNVQTALGGLPAIGLDLHKTKNVLKVPFGFAVQSVFGSTYALNDDVGNPAIIPAKALIQRAYLDCYTAYTGPTATVAFGITGSNSALLAATAVASLTGLVEGVPTNTMSTAVKVGATAVQVNATIATANLTAGASNLFIEYVLSN